MTHTVVVCIRKDSTTDKTDEPMCITVRETKAPPASAKIRNLLDTPTEENLKMWPWISDGYRVVAGVEIENLEPDQKYTIKMQNGLQCWRGRGRPAEAVVVFKSGQCRLESEVPAARTRG